MSTEKVDILVIGAGPSGCVAASYLHQQGHKVKVVEKSKFPRFVIGESLLPRCMDHFEESGLLDCLKKQNFQIKRGARIVKKDQICDFDFSFKHTKGWDWTWQVPRADFDNALVNEVINKGVDVSFEEEVIDVKINEHHSVIKMKNKSGEISSIQTKYIVDSSGYGRVLPRLLDLDKPTDSPELAAIFTHVKDIKRPAGEEGNLFAFDVINQKTWLWVIPFSNGNTSIGFVGPSEFLESFEGSNEEVIAQMLELSECYGDQFKDADFLFEPIRIKNYAKSVKQLYGERFVLTGNSAEFLDPVFSSGVTFATESSLLAAKLITKELSGEKVNWEVEYSDYIKRGISVFSSFVKEWYTGNLQKIFFSRHDDKTKKQISAVLAGYVWDETNPFVKKHDRIIKGIARLIDMEKKKEQQLEQVPSV